MNLTEIYKNLSIASFILTGVFLLLAAFLFYKWKIPKIFGDLTGRSEKKRIAEIKERGIESVVSENYRAGVKRIYQTKGKTSSQELKTSGKLFSGKILSGRGNTGKTNSTKSVTGRMLFGKTSKSMELVNRKPDVNEMAFQMEMKKSVSDPESVTMPLEQYKKAQMNRVSEETVPLDQYRKTQNPNVEENRDMSEKTKIPKTQESYTCVLVKEDQNTGNDFMETGLLGLGNNQTPNLLSPTQESGEMKLVFSFESTGTDRIIQNG